jgi:hypothetical protein
LIRFERCLDPKGASGPTLTGKAVTDGDGKRIARDFQTKLPTVTGGFSGSHRYETYCSVRVEQVLHLTFAAAAGFCPSRPLTLLERDAPGNHHGP